MKGYLLYNVVVVSMIASGTFALYKAFGPLSLSWSTFVAYSLYYQLRKDLCTNCPFYGRPCFSGWGLLASKLFEKGSGDFERGKRLAKATWFVFLAIPLTVLLYFRAWTSVLLWLFGSYYLFSEFSKFHESCPLRERCS